jgi:hypothetical protein
MIRPVEGKTVSFDTGYNEKGTASLRPVKNLQIATGAA